MSFCVHVLQPKGRKFASQLCRSNLSFRTQFCAHHPRWGVHRSTEGSCNARLHLSPYDAGFRQFLDSNWYLTLWPMISTLRLPKPDGSQDALLLPVRVYRLKNRELSDRKWMEISYCFDSFTYRDKWLGKTSRSVIDLLLRALQHSAIYRAQATAWDTLRDTWASSPPGNIT